MMPVTSRVIWYASEQHRENDVVVLNLIGIHLMLGHILAFNFLDEDSNASGCT
jgi:hypothetical protein